MTILIWDFKTKLFPEPKNEGHFTILKGPIHSKQS